MKIIEETEAPEPVYRQASVRIHRDGHRETDSRSVATEYGLRLRLNGKFWTELICTPTHLAELVLGHLLSEGMIRSAEQVESLRICRARGIAECTGEFWEPWDGNSQDKRSVTDDLTQISAAGLSVSARQEATLPASLDRDRIFGMLEAMEQEQPLHRATRSAHGCCLDVKGEPLFICEDIRRHNALDKAIGYALRRGYDRKSAMLYTTGRAPVDMVQKVIRSGIPVFVSKRLPTRQAVELAARCGLTLLGQARQDEFQVFSPLQAGDLFTET